MSKEIIVERGTKTVYREGSKIVKQFKAGYPKSAVIKEAFNHALADGWHATQFYRNLERELAELTALFQSENQ